MEHLRGIFLRKSRCTVYFYDYRTASITALLIHVCKRRTCEQDYEQEVIFEQVVRHLTNYSFIHF